MATTAFLWRDSKDSDQSSVPNSVRCSSLRGCLTMPFAKRISIVLSFTLASLSAATWAQAPSFESVLPVLEAWQVAVENQEYDDYVNHLHSSARQIPEYASQLAMKFWGDELLHLRDQGFSGEFRFKSAGGESDLLPPGTVLAHPCLVEHSLPCSEEHLLPEAIMLLQEADDWKILAIFSSR